MAATCAGFTNCDPELPGVSIVPGNTAFAAMQRSLFSNAMVRIRETSAALDALYAPTSAAGSTA